LSVQKAQVRSFWFFAPLSTIKIELSFSGLWSS